MKSKKFTPDEEATNITFKRIYPGADCHMIQIIPDTGPDFILPEHYDSMEEVNAVIKRLREAYQLGKLMEARRIAAKLAT